MKNKSLYALSNECEEEGADMRKREGTSCNRQLNAEKYGAVLKTKYYYYYYFNATERGAHEDTLNMPCGEMYFNDLILYFVL